MLRRIKALDVCATQGRNSQFTREPRMCFDGFISPCCVSPGMRGVGGEGQIISLYENYRIHKRQ